MKSRSSVGPGMAPRLAQHVISPAAPLAPPHGLPRSTLPPVEPLWCRSGSRRGGSTWPSVASCRSAADPAARLPGVSGFPVDMQPTELRLPPSHCHSHSPCAKLLKSSLRLDPPLCPDPKNAQLHGGRGAAVRRRKPICEGSCSCWHWGQGGPIDWLYCWILIVTPYSVASLPFKIHPGYSGLSLFTCFTHLIHLLIC